jgi:hypothetical protein
MRDRTGGQPGSPCEELNAEDRKSMLGMPYGKVCIRLRSHSASLLIGYLPAINCLVLLMASNETPSAAAQPSTARLLLPPHLASTRGVLISPKQPERRIVRSLAVRSRIALAYAFI